MARIRPAAGFTLIEVMIVVAIVATLAAIAYPSYRESLARSRRADAKAVLLENMQLIERQYTISNAYDRKGDGTPLDTVPVARAPKEGSIIYYDVSFTGAHDATQYTLSAVPRIGMTGDRCGTFTLTNAGTKGVTGASSTATECWDK